MQKLLFILCGASGDLAQKKLIPALYHLYAYATDKEHIRSCIFLGISHEATDFSKVLSSVIPFIEDFNQAIWQEFIQCWHYQQASITNKDDVAILAKKAIELEQCFALSGSRILYAAIGAHLFESLIINASQTGLITKQHAASLTRHVIIFEKPFGHDYHSAHIMNEAIKQRYHEHQIYRIDHYLTKEIVSNIALIRFTNLFFEPLWNNQFIEQVHIVLDEKATIKDRGGYYDQFGALSDVVQNHLLQLLALTAMESPLKLTANQISDERAKILKKVSFVDGLLGQYDGYHDEKQVKKDSLTETFALLIFKIEHPLWENVPFIISTGKAMDQHQVGIYVKFKNTQCLLTKGCPTESNSLTIQLSPDRRFYLTLNVKKAGVVDEVVQTVMEVNPIVKGKTIFGSVSYEPYEHLLRSIINNQDTIAINWDEIETAWNIIDTIKKSNIPLYTYAKNSKGPEEIDNFLKKMNITYHHIT